MHNMLTDNSFPKIIDVINYCGRESMNWLSDLNEVLGMIGMSGFLIVLWSLMPVLMLVFLIMFIGLASRHSRENNKAIRENNAALTEQIKSLADAVAHLSDKVIDPPMGLEDSLEYFYLIMHEHVGKKLEYLGDILRKNSINSRKKQIQKNIANEFQAITTKEAAKLSRKKSVCGDMGKALQENIDWDMFLNEVYAAFFVERKKDCDSEFDYFKIQDIKTIMYGKVDSIAKILEDNGAHN